MTPSFASPRAWFRVGVGALVLAVVGVGALLGWRGFTANPSGSAFPTEVAGLPVMTVPQAADLLRSGKFDGRAVAVAGYFAQFMPSCPPPDRYIGPLESWCRFVAFADSRDNAQLCQPMGPNGISCHQPSGTFLEPFVMSETSGSAASWLTGGATGDPAALVLVGHAGDPRQWDCAAATQAECANAFVVDKLAWAEGRDVPLTVPQTGDLESGRPLTPSMAPAQVVAAIGLGDGVLTVAAYRAGDIATIDPRFAFAGDNLVWLARSLAPADASQGEGMRAETVWLVDDATGRIIDSRPLQLDATFQPARVWRMATVHGLECCGTNVLAFERVRSADGMVVHEGILPGSASGAQDSTIFGGGYGSPPLVLSPGRYSITAWLATYNGGVSGAPSQACASEVTVAALDDVTLNAVFPSGQACSFAPAPSGSPVTR
jgi:hypothetical protein